MSACVGGVRGRKLCAGIARAVGTRNNAGENSIWLHAARPLR